MKKKKCSRCNKIKGLDDFNKRKSSIDGYRSECKICHRKIGLEYYYNNREKRKAYDRLYNEKNKDKKRSAREKYKKRFPHKVKRMMQEATRKYIEKNPEKRDAYIKVYCAIKKGTIKKEACKNCGSLTDLMAHHEDYNKPLEVIWLCRTCHILEHKILRYGNSYLKRSNPSQFCWSIAQR